MKAFFSAGGKIGTDLGLCKERTGQIIGQTFKIEFIRNKLSPGARSVKTRPRDHDQSLKIAIEGEI